MIFFLLSNNPLTSFLNGAKRLSALEALSGVLMRIVTSSRPKILEKSTTRRRSSRTVKSPAPKSASYSTGTNDFDDWPHSWSHYDTVNHRFLWTGIWSKNTVNQRFKVHYFRYLNFHLTASYILFYYCMFYAKFTFKYDTF